MILVYISPIFHFLCLENCSIVHEIFMFRFIFHHFDCKSISSSVKQPSNSYKQRIVSPFCDFMNFYKFIWIFWE